MQAWEDKTAEAEAKYEEDLQAHEAKKKEIDAQHEKDLGAHEQSVDDAHAAAVEEHKHKLDEQHAAATKEWEEKNKAYEDHKKKEEEHKARTPEPPEPVGPKPVFKDYKDAKKFDKDKAAWEKKSNQYKQAVAVHKTKKHAHSAEARALATKRPKKPGTKPKKPAATKGAPKHPGYTKGAPKKPKHPAPPKKPKHPEKPKAEDFAAKKPGTATEKASHQDHVQRANAARENIQSHLEQNKELSPEDRSKLEQIHEGLGGHTELDRMPTKEQTSELKQLERLGGAHGKKAHGADEAKKVEQEMEEVRPPQSDMEHAQLADHKAKAESMKNNIQSHLDSIDADPNMSPEEKESVTQKLKGLLSSLDNHAKLDTLPTKDQSAEMKEISKLAGEHGKKAYEPPKAGEEAATKTKTTTTTTGGGRLNLRGAFESGRRVGAAAARAAQDPYGAGDLGPQALNLASRGVLSAGGHLLNSPKRQKRVQETMKGLYLDLEGCEGLVIQKAVNSPNAGTTTDGDKRAQRKMKESYAKQPVGVMGSSGVAMEDDPDVGRKWQHNEEDSLDAELEEERKKKEDIEKSVDILKALRQSVERELSMCLPNPTEIEFMRDVLGHSEDSIRKGLVTIKGKDRHRFHEWSLQRLAKSVRDMSGV
jgi:hypothetical protein